MGVSTTVHVCICVIAVATGACSLDLPLLITQGSHYQVAHDIVSFTCIHVHGYFTN